MVRLLNSANPVPFSAATIVTWPSCHGNSINRADFVALSLSLSLSFILSLHVPLLLSRRGKWECWLELSNQSRDTFISSSCSAPLFFQLLLLLLLLLFLGVGFLVSCFADQKKRKMQKNQNDTLDVTVSNKRGPPPPSPLPPMHPCIHPLLLAPVWLPQEMKKTKKYGCIFLFHGSSMDRFRQPGSGLPNPSTPRSFRIEIPSWPQRSFVAVQFKFSCRKVSHFFILAGSSTTELDVTFGWPLT